MIILSHLSNAQHKLPENMSQQDHNMLVDVAAHIPAHVYSSYGKPKHHIQTSSSLTKPSCFVVYNSMVAIAKMNLNTCYEEN